MQLPVCFYCVCVCIIICHTSLLLCHSHVTSITLYPNPTGCYNHVYFRARLWLSADDVLLLLRMGQWSGLKKSAAYSQPVNAKKSALLCYLFPSDRVKSQLCSHSKPDTLISSHASVNALQKYKIYIFYLIIHLFKSPFNATSFSDNALVSLFVLDVCVLGENYNSSSPKNLPGGLKQMKTGTLLILMFSSSDSCESVKNMKSVRRLWSAKRTGNDRTFLPETKGRSWLDESTV